MSPHPSPLAGIVWHEWSPERSCNARVVANAWQGKLNNTVVLGIDPVVGADVRQPGGSALWLRVAYRPIAVSEMPRHSLPMKMHQWLVCVGLTLVAGPALARPSECGLPEMTGASELHRFLSLRAVEVVRLAVSRGDRLAALVTPSASFDLGAGDVGRPLGTGVDGARELARTMNADTYRFLGWDYMDMSADPCSKQKVEVEFIDSKGKNVSRVEFTFEAGRVVSADGWERSFETGQL